MADRNDFLLVSSHAIAQFQQRIAPMREAKARRFILAGIRQAVNVRLQSDGTSFRVRTRRPFPFEFRAYCVFDLEKDCFVVTTIVKGDSKVTRKQKHKAGQQASSDNQLTAECHLTAVQGGAISTPGQCGGKGKNQPGHRGGSLHEGG